MSGLRFAFLACGFAVILLGIAGSGAFHDNCPDDSAETLVYNDGRSLVEHALSEWSRSGTLPESVKTCAKLLEASRPSHWRYRANPARGGIDLEVGDYSDCGWAAWFEFAVYYPPSVLRELDPSRAAEGIRIARAVVGQALDGFLAEDRVEGAWIAGDTPRYPGWEISAAPSTLWKASESRMAHFEIRYLQGPEDVPAEAPRLLSWGGEWSIDT